MTLQSSLLLPCTLLFTLFKLPNLLLPLLSLHPRARYHYCISPCSIARCRGIPGFPRRVVLFFSINQPSTLTPLRRHTLLTHIRVSTTQPRSYFPTLPPSPPLPSLLRHSSYLRVATITRLDYHYLPDQKSTTRFDNISSRHSAITTNRSSTSTQADIHIPEVSIYSPEATLAGHAKNQHCSLVPLRLSETPCAPSKVTPFTHVCLDLSISSHRSFSTVYSLICDPVVELLLTIHLVFDTRTSCSTLSRVLLIFFAGTPSSTRSHFSTLSSLFRL